MALQITGSKDIAKLVERERQISARQERLEELRVAALDDVPVPPLPDLPGKKAAAAPTTEPAKPNGKSATFNNEMLRLMADQTGRLVEQVSALAGIVTQQSGAITARDARPQQEPHKPLNVDHVVKRDDDGNLVSIESREV